MPTDRNLSALVDTVRGVMDGRRVEVRLTNGRVLVGRIVRVDEDPERKPGAVASNGELSHLIVVIRLDVGVDDPLPLDRITEIGPAF